MIGGKPNKKSILAKNQTFVTGAKKLQGLNFALVENIHTCGKSPDSWKISIKMSKVGEKFFRHLNYLFYTWKVV